MAVLRREQRMDWLDLTSSERELLQQLPGGSFKIFQHLARDAQAAFAF